MSQLIFQNEEGTLRIGGGSAEAWRMTELSGLGLPTRNLQTAALSAEAGQRVFGERKNARLITLAGDVYPKGMALEARLSGAIRILDKPGWLIVKTKMKNRKIWARCSSLEFGKRIGVYREFQMQFYCESPYFEESKSISAALYKRERKLKKSFTLPCVMSERVSKGTVINSGDVVTEPIFEIYFAADGTENETGNIELKNHRNGISLKLSYVGGANETVTVDIPKRRIYNSNGDSLLYALSDDSFLSEFVLEKGENELEVVNHASRGVCVSCRFEQKYLEAAY